MSRFNTMAHGAARDAADELSEGDADIYEIRTALINALTRIDYLEREVARLKQSENA